MDGSVERLNKDSFPTTREKTGKAVIEKPLSKQGNDDVDFSKRKQAKGLSTKSFLNLHMLNAPKRVLCKAFTL